MNITDPAILAAIMASTARSALFCYNMAPEDDDEREDWIDSVCEAVTNVLRSMDIDMSPTAIRSIVEEDWSTMEADIHQIKMTRSYSRSG